MKVVNTTNVLKEKTYKIQEVTMSNILFPIQKKVPLYQLTYEEDYNRSEYEKVTLSFEDAIREDGFMDVVKVFPESDGYYKIAEATHRVRALKNIAGDNQSIEVPIAILHWIDGDSSEDVLSTIVSLNNTGKTWELFDYVKANANAKHHDERVRNTFQEILDNMKRLSPRLTNAIVAGIYTSEVRGHLNLKDKNKAIKFYVTSERRKYVNTLLVRIENLINKHGKKKITTQFLRRLIFILNALANRFIREANDKQEQIKNYEEWNKFFTRILDNIDSLVHANYLPEGDSPFEEWYKNIEKEHNIPTVYPSKK